MRRLSLTLLLVALTACGGADGASPPGEDLPRFSPEEMAARLEASERPTVVNVWASWCIPCRAEAPLLAEAHRLFADRVDFLGVNVQDTQREAAAFLEELSVPYENLFDPEASVRGLLGGSGVPITYFVLPGGEVAKTHFGVIDEQELALQLDELLRRSA